LHTNPAIPGERIVAISTPRLITRHAAGRCAQRNITEEDIRYVIEHGEREHRAGTLVVFLRKRDIPQRDRADQRIAQLEGLTVHLAQANDGTFSVVVTAYRNRERGLKEHRRKKKYNTRRYSAA